MANDDHDHDETIVRHHQNGDLIILALCIGLLLVPLLIVVLIVKAIWRGWQRRQDERMLDRAVAEAQAWDRYEADARADLVAFLLKAERRR